MYPVLFQIGPVTIYSLGVFWALGAMCAAYIVGLELRRYRLDRELASTMVFAAAVGGLLGARLLFIIEEWDGFLWSPWDYILSGSGFSWFGGVGGWRARGHLAGAALALERVQAGPLKTTYKMLPLFLGMEVNP